MGWGRRYPGLHHHVAFDHAIVVAADDAETNVEAEVANDVLDLVQGDEEDGGRILARLAARHLVVEEDETVDLAANEEDEHEAAQGDGGSVELLAEVLVVDGQKLARAKVHHDVAQFTAAAKLLGLVVYLVGGRDIGEMDAVLLLGQFALGGGGPISGTRGALDAGGATISMGLPEENPTAVSVVVLEVVEEGRVADGRKPLGLVFVPESERGPECVSRETAARKEGTYNLISQYRGPAPWRSA